MKFIHTSDWHLGHSLHGRQRHTEFARFLDWLLTCIHTEKVDALLIAGDVFDSSMPGTRAQELYYHFLSRLHATGCRHAVITAGNHDSPSFLDAPRGILKKYGIHVIGRATTPQEEVIPLYDPIGQAQAIICAVPYLRERDLRGAEAGESSEDKARKLVQGAQAHYAAVAKQAQALQKTLAQGTKPVPIIAMGHLFASGASVGESERSLYVGTLGQLPASIFPPCMDYVALGHLHKQQCVGGQEHCRYCGSPLALDFTSAGHTGSICLVDCLPGHCSVRQIHVPTFQALAHIKGDWPTISQSLEQLGSTGQRIWLEIVYTGAHLPGDLREMIQNAIQGSALDVLRIRDARITATTLTGQQGEMLEDLSVHDVFERCLAAHHIPDDQRATLRQHYQEVLLDLADAQAQAQQDN